MKKISIIIPCYNEQEAIPYFYEEINKISKQIKKEFEFIFIKLLDENWMGIEMFARGGKFFTLKY